MTAEYKEIAFILCCLTPVYMLIFGSAVTLLRERRKERRK